MSPLLQGVKAFGSATEVAYAQPPAASLPNASTPVLSPSEAALAELGWLLQASGYRFICVTPETHGRVLARDRRAPAGCLRDIFGWSRPFSPRTLPAKMLELLQRGRALARRGDQWISRVRYSTLDDCIFVHSSYPTVHEHSVFFGPDTYRFARFIRQTLKSRARRPRAIVDLGCGTGAGGIVAARALAGARHDALIFADINPHALTHAWVNATLAGLDHFQCVQGDLLTAVDAPFDLIVANPPYIADSKRRIYRDGGGPLGCDLSVRMLRESLERLLPGGQLILYTGAPIVGGRDVFRDAIAPLLLDPGLRSHYCEIDPDVFGSELEKPAYTNVERIAAVGLVLNIL